MNRMNGSDIRLTFYREKTMNTINETKTNSSDSSMNTSGKERPQLNFINCILTNLSKHHEGYLYIVTGKSYQELNGFSKAILSWIIVDGCCLKGNLILYLMSLRNRKS